MESEEKQYTKEDLKVAYQAGHSNTEYDFDWGASNQLLTEFDEWFESWSEKVVIEEKEEDLPFMLWFIKEKCGWSRWCDVTGSNHYMLNEYTIDDTDVFYCTRSQAETLGLI